MDTQRLLIFLGLSFVVLMLWEAWHEQEEPLALSPATTISNDTPGVAQMPTESGIVAEPVVDSDKPSIPASTPDTPEKPGAIAQSSLNSSERIHVETDVLDIDLDMLGGDLRRAFLLKFPVNTEKPLKPYPLMDDALPQLFIAQSGLLANASAPDHHARYQGSQNEYKLEPGMNELVVPMVWQSDDGIKVTKTYTFQRDSYLIKVDHLIENTSGAEWKGRLYQQLQRNQYDEPGKSRMLYTFTGAAVSTPTKPYEKINFEDMAEWKPEQSYVTGGWAAILQHYFVTAWIPANDDVNHLYTRQLKDDRYVVGMTSNEESIKAGGTFTFTSHIYIGPKEQDKLEAIAPNLNLTVDYGFLTVIAQPLFWALKYIHSYVGNWGWAIILLTLMIKLVFYKLSEASYRSMANMRALAPKFQSIRERFGDDRQRMSQAMMELYKKEKVNPFSGCWPMLVQIPVFIALYWMLLESVEMRQAPFILWIQDLSAKDPYYILPLLMGLSMYIQQKLSANPSLDPMQQKIMQFLPLIFTLFFMLFPAGLVLYWVVNNVLSILQQWYITRRIEQQGALKK